MIRRRVMVCHQTSKVPSFPGSLERCLEMKRGGCGTRSFYAVPLPLDGVGGVLSNKVSESRQPSGRALEGSFMSHHTRLTTSLVLFVTAFAQAGELPTAEPDAVGLSPGKLDRLKPALQKLVDDGKIPGGVAVVAHRGKVAYVASFGYRNLESKEPMTVDTIFAIASMTKPITCVWVMRLVEQGKIGLDDPISKYLPELKDLRVLGDPKYQGLRTTFPWVFWGFHGKYKIFI